MHMNSQTFDIYCNVNTYVRTYTHWHMTMHVYACLHMHKHKHMHTHIHMYAHTYTHRYIHRYMHTHIHIFIFSNFNFPGLDSVCIRGHQYVYSDAYHIPKNAFWHIHFCGKCQHYIYRKLHLWAVLLYKGKKKLFIRV